MDAAPPDPVAANEDPQASPPEAQANTQPRTLEQLAEALYAKLPEPERLPVPESIAKLRADEPGRTLYAASYPSRDAVGAIAEYYADLPELQRQSGSREVAEMALDIGLSDGDVRQWVGFANALRANPLPADQAQATAAKRLVEVFGKDAAQALADARALVARDPRVGPMLERSGLGNHPDVIVHFAQQARRERVRGRL
ncbi:MAG: hypothetical protein HZB40_16690 [Rhodocyclales bacterium]|nr:hypothetical protein [Rhodocyclales bacterium]